MALSAAAARRGLPLRLPGWLAGSLGGPLPVPRVVAVLRALEGAPPLGPALLLSAARLLRGLGATAVAGGSGGRAKGRGEWVREGVGVRIDKQRYMGGS